MTRRVRPRSRKKLHRVRTFPGADHAFFNSTGPRYNPVAAREAYRELLRWFERHLATD